MRKLTIAMTLLVLTLLVSGLTPLAQANQPPDPKIVGGNDVPNPNPYVYQVSIGNAPHTDSNSHYCGGSLIAARWVLSAAHCFVSSETGAVTPIEQIGVLVGVRDLRELPDGAARSVTRLIVHPDYNQETSANDMALLELNSPVEAGLIVPLADTTNDATLTAPGTTATATGWGGLLGYAPGEEEPPGGQQYPDVLQVVQIPVVANNVCAEVNDGLSDSQLCAGLAEGGKDTCQGDSGGPLVVDNGAGGFVQIGVVSFGQGCAAANTYGVYARVSAYRDWISTSINPTNLTPQVWLPVLER